MLPPHQSPLCVDIVFSPAFLDSHCWWWWHETFLSRAVLIILWGLILHQVGWTIPIPYKSSQACSGVHIHSREPLCLDMYLPSWALTLLLSCSSMDTILALLCFKTLGLANTKGTYSLWPCLGCDSSCLAMYSCLPHLLEFDIVLLGHASGWPCSYTTHDLASLASLASLIRSPSLWKFLTLLGLWYLTQRDCQHDLSSLSV